MNPLEESKVYVFDIYQRYHTITFHFFIEIELTNMLQKYNHYKGEVKGWAQTHIDEKSEHIKALCLPLISIINAIGNPIVDYFSLDIEGLELDVLKSIPWDQVNIKVRIM